MFMSYLKTLFESIITEEINITKVTDAIRKRKPVKITYKADDEPRGQGERIIHPVAYGISKAGNMVLRAFQPYGDTKTKTPHWKLFRLDRITKWRPLKNSKFNLQPKDQGFDAPAYNEIGDNSLASVIDQVKFDSNDNGLYQPELDKLRKQTDQLINHSNALDLSKLKSVPRGPIRQKKNNIYTSRPNSKAYAQYRKNMADTERDAEQMKNYWDDYDKASQLRDMQNQVTQTDDDMNNIRGPLWNDNDEYNNDYEEK